MAGIDLSGFSDVVQLGSGGLGDVYRATRTSTGGSVAIKVLRDWTDRDVAWQRAQRELRALVDLRGHANVVNVEEVIDTDGTLAIVMEHAPGGSVIDLMRDQGGTLDFADTLLVATDTAAALTAAHERGIIHRDIKPHNLLIGAFGNIKVCDFGIAALTHSDEVSNRTSSLSFRYASPEELRGDDDVGPAADIYSLAATIHHLLTGNYMPAPDGTAGSLPLRTWTAPDDLSANVELDFRALIVRSADRDPENRPTAKELHQQLDNLATQLGDNRTRALPFATNHLDDHTHIRGINSPDRPAAPIAPVAAEGIPRATIADTTPPTPAAHPPTLDPANTIARTTHIRRGDAAPQPETATNQKRSRTTVAIFVAIVALLAIGGIGFGLGWVGGGDDDTAEGAADSDGATPIAIVTTENPTTPVAATTSEPVTPVVAAPTTETATTTSTTSSSTTVPPTTTTIAPTTTTTLPERYGPRHCPGDGPCIAMVSIDIIDDEYSISWDSSFAPSTGSTHAHFFWDIYDPSQVGSSAADQAPWELTDQQPFVPATEMRLANRPAEATGICVTPANASHQVIDPAYYDCAYVPAGEAWTAG